MKDFEKYQDACSYARANPGLVVLRNEENWIVGDRRSIFEINFNRQKRSTNNLLPDNYSHKQEPQTELKKSTISGKPNSTRSTQPLKARSLEVSSEYEAPYSIDRVAWDNYLEAQKHDAEQQGYR